MHFAAQAVLSGTAGLVVAGGVQNMSQVPIGAAMGAEGPFTNSQGWRERYALASHIPATAYALHQAGMSLAGIDLIEINEAFASVVLAWQRETGADLGQVNVCGGAIAFGHPLGATGARLLTTLVHALERTGGRYGLLTMCEGGGQANVTIIERV